MILPHSAPDQFLVGHITIVLLAIHPISIQKTTLDKLCSGLSQFLIIYVDENSASKTLIVRFTKTRLYTTFSEFLRKPPAHLVTVTATALRSPIVCINSTNRGLEAE